jgi:hypothetical protein
MAGGLISIRFAPEPTRRTITGAAIPHCSCLTGGATSTSAAIGPSILIHSRSAVMTSASDHTSGFGGSACAVSGLVSAGMAALSGAPADEIAESLRTGSAEEIAESLRIGSSRSGAFSLRCRLRRAATSNGSSFCGASIMGTRMGRTTSIVGCGGGGRDSCVPTAEAT